ncbi:MAG: ATPase, T2SS/T4P/T4SS family, partial [Desulfatirhabdiaceae bacterium]|nr:ATPase, T2SS/T4P/T4SS family [Desulfatirhabdiaceae bacterium]
GEIRCPETAEIAFHAALSGRTVLSTLHADDSTGAVARLLESGIAAGIVSSTLHCVLAQRLVRRICRKCTALHTPSVKTLESFGLASLLQPALKKGRGCAICNYTGYSGRRPIIEFWLPTREELVELIGKPDNLTLRQRVFGRADRTTLLEDGFKRALAGETTLEELLRVLPHDQIESDRDRLKPMLDS